MQRTTILLAAFAILAFAIARRSKPIMPARFNSLSRWQKIFGVVAIILAMLILLNPDFLALGLLGDTTFFDLLVLALSCQLLVYVQWTWRGLSAAIAKTFRWAGIPSPGLLYLIAISAAAFASAASSIHKILHRFLT